MQDYSQSGEQPHILEAFGDKVGRFLDIGACDGKLGSNSLALVERGWSGVLVEASPRAFLKLQELHGNNPKLVLINAAVGLNTVLSPFWDGPGPALGYATTEGKNRAKWEHHCSFQNPFYLVTVSLHRLLSMVDPSNPFDFVSIDTEGTSTDLFVAYPFREPYPKVVCVEHDERIPECLAVAKSYQYREVARNPQNLVLVRD